jgi:hypothetical protein
LSTHRRGFILADSLTYTHGAVIICLPVNEYPIDHDTDEIKKTMQVILKRDQYEKTLFGLLPGAAGSVLDGGQVIW